MTELTNDFLKVVNHMPQRGINIILGTDGDGRTVFTDLSKLGHIMVTSDSVYEIADTILSIKASLVCRNDVNRCSIFAIDLKNNSNLLYEERNHVIYISDLDYAVGFLNMCCTLMQKRKQIVMENGVNYISELDDPFLFPIVIIIEHADELMNKDRNTYRYINSLIDGMYACGIHLILGYDTSRVCLPAETIVKKMPARVAFSKTGLSDIERYYRTSSKNTNEKTMKFYKKATGNSITINPLSIMNIELNYAILKIYYVEPQELRSYNSSLLREAKEFYRCIIEVKDNRLNVSRAPQKPRRIGLLRRMWNLWNVKPVMFVSSEYPIRLK